MSRRPTPQFRRWAHVVAVTALAAGAAGAATACANDRAGGECDRRPHQRTTVAYERVDGVDPDLTSLDVHAPADACGAPVVVWVHGGGYRIGDKRIDIADKVELFGAHGWVLVSVNYRLTDPVDPSTTRYPDHYDDVATAVAWVHSNIARYGGDPDRIALLGHSAGADIVSNVVLAPDLLAQHDLRATDLACVGPLDSEGFDKVAAGDADIRGLEQEWVAALGNEPEFRKRTSANWLVQPGMQLPPFITVVRGSGRRQAIERELVAKLRDIGVATTVIDARSLTHHQVNARIGAPGDRVMTEPLVRFLSNCFGTE